MNDIDGKALDHWILGNGGDRESLASQLRRSRQAELCPECNDCGVSTDTDGGYMVCPECNGQCFATVEPSVMPPVDEDHPLRLANNADVPF